MPSRPRRPYTKHGYTSLRRRFEDDELTIREREYLGELELEILEEGLGGAANASPQERLVCRMLARSRALLNHVDAALESFVEDGSGLVIRHPRGGGGARVLNLVLERHKLQKSVLDCLRMIGMERRSAPAQSLAEVLAEAKNGHDVQSDEGPDE